MYITAICCRVAYSKHQTCYLFMYLLGSI